MRPSHGLNRTRSDIGGSVRIPAHYSGLFGLKTCAGRIPLLGAVAPNRGFESVITSLGPMGRCVDDLALIAEVLFNASAETFATLPRLALPLPFRQVALPEKLKFGYYRSDNLFQASPACQRAVTMTVEALERDGHECVAIEPPDAAEALRIFVALTSADAYERLLSNLDGDPSEPALFLIQLQKRLGPTLMGWISWLAPSDPKLFHITAQAGKKEVQDVYRWNAARDDLVLQIRQQLWNTELGLDGVICPVQAIPALKHGQGWNLAFLAAATLLYK